MPAYLENPSEPLQAGDKERYQSQLVCVRKIIATFDEPGYSDEDPARSKKIVDLMSEVSPVPSCRHRLHHPPLSIFTLSSIARRPSSSRTHLNPGNPR